MRAAICALLLAGCATTYQHETKSPQEFQVDAFECQRIAHATIRGPDFADELNRNALVDRCMQAKGWRPE
jgi:uncharacterized lipoprotein YmbA